MDQTRLIDGRNQQTKRATAYRAIPSSVTRFGAVLHTGFLHWGYNYWNRALTRELVDPFHMSDAGRWPADREVGAVAGPGVDAIRAGNNPGGFSASPKRYIFFTKPAMAVIRAVSYCDGLYCMIEPLTSSMEARIGTP